MRLLLLWFSLILVLCGALPAQQTGPDDLSVVAEGMAVLGSDPAAAEEEAVWDAKRNAVEQAVGVFLRARSVGRDFEIVEKEIRAEAQGFVRGWQLLPDSRRVERVGNGRLLRVKIRATVGLLPVISKLADIQDVYNDLERPRIRVDFPGGGPFDIVHSALVAALKAEGFEVASNGPAEIVLTGRLESEPTIRFGDNNAPFGIGQTVAACRVRLTLHVLSASSEEVILARQSQGAGRSFEGDAGAAREAAREAVESVLSTGDVPLLRKLLVRWARERQEGHVVAVTVTGLMPQNAELLKEQLRAMRGFVRFVAVTSDAKRTIVRFQTRLETRAVRRRLAELAVGGRSLAPQAGRGPFILCSLVTPRRLSRR